MNNLSRHPTSLYQAIAARLEDELHKHYHGGEYLPAEKQLALRFAVNRHTLRRAVDELVKKGLVRRQQGRGVLVLMKPYDYPLHARAHFSHNLLEQGRQPSGRCINASLRPCEDHTAAALGIEPGRDIIYLRTLRYVDGIPVGLIDHYLPDVNWWPMLKRFTQGSLHEFIQLECGAVLTRHQTRIGARLAQDKESSLLQMPRQVPLICMRTLNKIIGGDALAEYSVGLTRADMVELILEH